MSEVYRELRVYQRRGLCDCNGDPLSDDALQALERLAESQQLAIRSLRQLDAAFAVLTDRETGVKP